MIRFKNKVYEDYFIDPVTTVVTDKFGNVRNQYLTGGKHKYYSVRIDGILMHVHRIMAHTYLGYKPEPYVVDHINDNKLDNRLENLQYLTRGKNVSKGVTGIKRLKESIEKTRQKHIGRKASPETRQKQRESKLGRIHWINIKTGEHKFQKDRPSDDWVKGTKIKQ